MHQRLRAGRDHCDRVTEIQSNRVLQLLLSKPDLLYEVRPARPIDHAPQFDAQHDISSMPLRSKQALNVVLASSVVQLSVAKWLGRFWTRDDLVFQRLPGGMKPLPYISFPQLGDPGMRGWVLRCCSMLLISKLIAWCSGLAKKVSNTGITHQC